jgi:hypothetical protein
MPLSLMRDLFSKSKFNFKRTGAALAANALIPALLPTGEGGTSLSLRERDRG